MTINTNPKTAAQERDKITDELLKARPSQGLITTLNKFSGNAALNDALNEIAPFNRIPKDVRDFLLKLKGKNEKCVAFLRVVFAQAERRFSPVSDDPRYSATLGFRRKEDFDALLKHIALQEGRVGRKSGRGKVDPYYSWFQADDHELPDLASALGLTPEGLKKRCSGLKIKITQSAVSKRARKIRSQDALRLMLLQLDKPVNERCDMARKILQWNGITSGTPLGGGIFSHNRTAVR
jgi:hypothetical protein